MIFDLITVHTHSIIMHSEKVVSDIFTGDLKAVFELLNDLSFQRSKFLLHVVHSSLQCLHSHFENIHSLLYTVYTLSECKNFRIHFLKLSIVTI